MTPTSLGVVVVGDDQVSAAERDAFEVRVESGTDVRAATQRAAAAAEAIVTTRGYRLKSIGVTWSDHADAQASMLMASLRDAGFDNVVPIRLPEATEALARGVSEVIGYQTSAVCVIEPDTAIALVVRTGDGVVQTAINNNIDSDDALIGWLSAVFTRADWKPEVLVLVGSAGGFDTVRARLEWALSVPVFAPAEAPLALARGAALASSHESGLPFRQREPLQAAPTRPRPFSSSRALAGVLVAGVLTFVVSVSLAVTVQLSPRPPVAAPVSEATPAVRPVPPPASAVTPPEVQPSAPIPESVAEVVPAESVPVESVPAEFAPHEVVPPAEVDTMEAAPIEVPVQAPPPPIAAPPLGAGAAQETVDATHP